MGFLVLSEKMRPLLHIEIGAALYQGEGNAMKLRYTLGMVALFGLAATGCSETTHAAGQATTPRWERRVLANGVELLVSSEAGPDAQKVADDVQSEMRSRYIGA